MLSRNEYFRYVCQELTPRVADSKASRSSVERVPCPRVSQSGPYPGAGKNPSGFHASRRIIESHVELDGLERSVEIGPASRGRTRLPYPFVLFSFFFFDEISPSVINRSVFVSTLVTSQQTSSNIYIT